MSVPKETPRERVSRWAEDVEPDQVEGLATMLGLALTALDDNNREAALAHIRAAIAALAGLHLVMFMEVPSYCTPEMRAMLEKHLEQFRRMTDLAKRAQDSEPEPTKPDDPKKAN
jgi:hypothetical protein